MNIPVQQVSPGLWRLLPDRSWFAIPDSMPDETPVQSLHACATPVRVAGKISSLFDSKRSWVGHSWVASGNYFYRPEFFPAGPLLLSGELPLIFSGKPRLMPDGTVCPGLTFPNNMVADRHSRGNLFPVQGDDLASSYASGTLVRLEWKDGRIFGSFRNRPSRIVMDAFGVPYDERLEDLRDELVRKFPGQNALQQAGMDDLQLIAGKLDAGWLPVFLWHRELPGWMRSLAEQTFSQGVSMPVMPDVSLEEFFLHEGFMTLLEKQEPWTVIFLSKALQSPRIAANLLSRNF